MEEKVMIDQRTCLFKAYSCAEMDVRVVQWMKVY